MLPKLSSYLDIDDRQHHRDCMIDPFPSARPTEVKMNFHQSNKLNKLSLGRGDAEVRRCRGAEVGTYGIYIGCYNHRRDLSYGSAYGYAG